MSWINPLDHGLDFLEDTIPDLAGVKLSPKPVDHCLDPEALFAEPRSLDSSELSDSSTEEAAPAWTPEQDSNLLEQVESTNHEWETVAKSFPNSTPQSVKRRWNKISQNRNKHDWTDEEDRLILSLYKTHGGNWKKISTFFTGLTSSNIKNRFYGCIKRRMDVQAKTEQDSLALKKPDVKVNEKAIPELTAEEKRIKLESLYHKISEIENYMKKAKSQIQQLVAKQQNTK